MSEVPDYIPDKVEVRSALPLAYVCARLGLDVTTSKNGHCPFHEDSNPSFGLFVADDGVQRWNCYPCGLSGDVYDLLQRLLNITFPEALEQARVYLAEMPEGWVAPAPPVKSTVGPSDWEAEVHEARLNAASDSHPGIMAARVGFAPVDDYPLCVKWDRYLRDVWGWGFSPTGEIMIPHWNGDNQLVACRVRWPDGGKTSLPGSDFSNLYGTWHGRHHREVLILEGESDAVFAGYCAREEGVNIDVFALPSGANAAIEDSWVQLVKRAETIYLALDPDPVGIEATWKWLDALKGTNVKVCMLPLGRDLRDARPSIRHLLSSARTPLPAPEIIQVPKNKSGYWRQGKDGDERQVTHWFIEPVAQLTGGDPGFDVVLHYRGTKKKTVIRLADMSGMRELRRWCTRHGITFTGREDDAQRINDHVLWRGCVLPEVYQTDQVGLQAPPKEYEFTGPSVAFPDGYLGKMPWRYVPSIFVSDVSDRVYLPAEGKFRWEWFRDFLSLSEPGVMQPLLAWMVAAARRPEVVQFPILFIGGSSGVGKSTLARLALRMMGSKIEIDLGAVTPFILLRTLSSTTSLPIFVDEWTRMSRKDTREAFQGAIPVLYTRGTAERGQADLSSSVYKLTAPTVVAGEDTFMLDRELQRTINIRPSRDAQKNEELWRIQDEPLELFGQMLHNWLATTTLDLPVLDTTVSDRVQYNLNLLTWGWDTLRLFLEDASHGDLTVPTVAPEVDLSKLTALSDDDVENVYDQALLAGMSMSDNDHHRVVWADPEGRGTWARFQQLVGLLQIRNVDIQLPGGSRAMKDYFEERHGKLELGPSVTPPGTFIGLRAWLIPGYELPDTDTTPPTDWIP